MVHQRTLEAYEAAGVEYIPTPHDVNERYFNNWIKQSGRQPERIVNRITRIRTTPNKNKQSEFITWSERKVGYDHVGNEKTFTEDKMGTYTIPIFVNEFDQSTNTIKAQQIDRHETLYEVPFSPEELDKLNKLADPVKIKYYVQLGTNRYSIADYEDFRNGRFEHLLQLGKSEKMYLHELNIPDRKAYNNTNNSNNTNSNNTSNSRGKNENQITSVKA